MDPENYSTGRMDPEKKIGILFILIAICIPLAAIPFLSGYSKDKGVIANLYGLAIEIKKDEGKDSSGQDAAVEKAPRRTLDFSRTIPKRIPFRIFLAFTLIFLYPGIVRIDAARRRERERTEGFGGPRRE